MPLGSQVKGEVNAGAAAQRALDLVSTSLAYIQAITTSTDLLRPAQNKSFPTDCYLAAEQSLTQPALEARA